MTTEGNESKRKEVESCGNLLLGIFLFILGWNHEISVDGALTSAPEQEEGATTNVYYQPSVEIVQEFKVENNSFSAEFGNNSGTVVNIVLKEGGNKLEF